MKVSFLSFIIVLLLIIGCEKDKPTKPVQEAPTITLTSPINGASVVDTVLITATASDNKGVIKVEFYIDATLRHTDLLEPYQYAWDCMEEADSSQHTIYAKAYDGDGHSTASSVVTVTVDYAYGPPSPVTLSYVVPSLTDSTVLHLSWTQSSAVDFNSYRIYRSLTAGVTEASDLVTEILRRTTTIYEDSGLTMGQTYYYRVFVYDNDTLAAGSNEVSGTPVWEGPTITLTIPADSDTVVNTVVITASASDNKGVVKVEFYIDETLRHTDLLEPYAYAWDCMEEADSSHHTIYAKAYDRDGYSATSVVVTVTVDYSYGPPLPVTLSYVTPSPTDSTVLHLGWTQSGAVDFNSYRIYRSLTAGVTEASYLVKEILQRTTTTYKDSGLTTRQTYYYRVFVYDNDALSAGSNELSATPKANAAGFVTIEQMEPGVNPGDIYNLGIIWQGNVDVCGFKLLVEWDPTVLTLLDVLRGNCIDVVDFWFGHNAPHYKWENFHYEQFFPTEIHKQKVKLVGWCDIPDGYQGYPLLRSPMACILAYLKFQVKNDATLKEFKLPVRFEWDAGTYDENTFSDPTGNIWYVSADPLQFPYDTTVPNVQIVKGLYFTNGGIRVLE